jgi:small subunit ribosomal protein S4e
MARGPKKHLKRVNAPHHWMLGKMGGTWAPRPSTGPHKRSECLPLVICLRNRLRYALTFREALMILKEKGGHIRVDAKARTDPKFPTGFQDVISITSTNEHFRLLYDIKGRFAIHPIDPEEAKFKLCKVKTRLVAPNHVPYIVTHDGRTIRYPHPDIKVNDTIKYELETGVITDMIALESGNLIMVTGGKNTGRVGTISHTEKHDGGFEIVHVRDSKGHTFATRLGYAFVIGKGKKSLVSLPKGEGVKESILEEQARRFPESVSN